MGSCPFGAARAGWDPAEHPRGRWGRFEHAGTTGNLGALRKDLLEVQGELKAEGGHLQVTSLLGQATWSMLHGDTGKAHALLGDAGVALKKQDPAHPALQPLRNAWQSLDRIRGRRGETTPMLAAGTAVAKLQAQAHSAGMPPQVLKALAGAARQIGRENARGAEGYLAQAEADLWGSAKWSSHPMVGQLRDLQKQLAPPRRGNVARAWDEAQHPRVPGGKHGGGEFAGKERQAGQAAGAVSYERNIMGEVTAVLPGGKRETFYRWMDPGLNLRTVRHPSDMPRPLYYGSNHAFAAGEQPEPGHAGNFVRSMSHVYMTEQPGSSETYKGARGYGAHVYQVEPTAWYGHRRDAKGMEWATAGPLRIIRELTAQEVGMTGTAGRALTHEPLGKPGGPGLWGMKGAQLPAFIQHMRNDIMQERGMPEDAATPIAISQCRKLAAKGNTQAMAAMAEFERLQAKAKATRSEPGMSSGYDPSGLDSSWDDPSGLPDLTGLGVPEFEAAETALGWQPPPGPPAARAAKLGSGGRFEALSSELGSRGARNPDALAAWIGRRKYGKGKFGQLAAAARKKAAPAAARFGHIVRFCPLEDIHILRTGEGDHSGRVVEAYAAVFDQPAVIHDAQGHYEETIDRGAFDQVLARISRSRGGLAAAVRVLYNHGKTIEGLPAPEFQRPIAKPLEVRPDGRGLITRSEYKKSPFAEEILDDIREGRITAQSFEGGIYRSDPELRGPGDRYRRRNGVLPRVRRLAVGLLNYGPALFAAYSGAEFLGVRMQLPDALLAEDEGEFYTEDEENPPDEGGVAGGTPGEVHPSRDHAHRLLAMRTEEMCREAGMSVLRRTWE